jgi:hypothetical protein
MTDSCDRPSQGLIVGLSALLIAVALLAAAFAPVLACPSCNGGILIAFSGQEGREYRCGECRGKGKVTLLAKWKYERDSKTLCHPR